MPRFDAGLPSRSPGERRERPPRGHSYSAEPTTDHAELRAALHELVGRFLADYERAALAHGLTLPQARALGFAACEPLSQRALAARFGCDPSNISVLVDRLVARELVERRPDPLDRRVKLIAATDAGRELAETCCRGREWLAAALDALDAEERDAVHAALRLLLR